MKLLYIDVNASFLNPTRNLIPSVLKHAGDVVFFGPGYVDGTTLSDGLEAFVDKKGPFDAVLSNTHIFTCDIGGGLPTAAQYRRGYDFAFPVSQIVELPRIAMALERLRVPRVVLLCEADTYNWDAAHIDALQRRFDYAIGGGPEFTPLMDEMRGLERESFAHLTTDKWAIWVRENPHRVASLIHFVSDEEFGWGRLEYRPNSWAVLGIQYDARGVAARTLRRSGIRPVMESPVRRGIGLLKRLRMMRKERRLIQRYLNVDFQLRLQTCRYAYTCGSAVDLWICKFLEIPAAGTVLLCKPFCGFAAAGYRDGENCIVCQPQNVMDVHRTLELDLDRAQRIADAGRDMVLRKHSVHARAAHMRDTLRSIADGTFAGARWVDGSYVIATKA